VSAREHDAAMDTTDTTATPLRIEQAMAIQIAALERLERAERELRIAGYRIDSRAIGVPLRYGVEDTLHYRAALKALDAAQVAFDAAQDLDCPDAEL
jgi:hypothetical protein